MINTLELFKHWAAEKNAKSNIIQLLNKDNCPVAALYLDKVDLNSSEVVICETSKTSEKYYLYINGIAIFFTYYKRTFDN